jgi:membrane-bound lytic murein transglycosylase F
MRFAIFILSLTLFLGASCSQNENQKSANETGNREVISPVDLDFDEIRERGYLTAAVDYSSTSYYVYKGELMGFEYELLKSLEDYFDIKVKIVVQPSIKAAIAQLNRGEIDLIAYPLTITKERKEEIAFTESYSTQRQMLVQRKPDNWRQMKLHEIERQLIRNQVDLINKEIHVLNASSYIDALKALADQIGGDINIIEMEPRIDSDEIIRMVAEGELTYTVADENIARVNQAYHPILDVETPISFPRRLAWAVRLNATVLLDTLSWGFKRLNKTARFNNLYNKYFKSSRMVREIAKSEYTSFAGNRLSPYDDLIKEQAKRIGWDWQLLASMVYQESKFDPVSTSWVGAQGLLQMMPATAKEYGVTNRTDPAQSLKGGTDYLIWLEKYWQPIISDPNELTKFIMASYNVGLGHVIDARALTDKFGGNNQSWEDVSINLLKLSNRQYYLDPVVKLGYARGSEPVNYVKEILERYERYKQLVS